MPSFRRLLQVSSLRYILGYDGSRLFVANNIVIDHDEQLGTYEKEGEIALRVRLH